MNKQPLDFFVRPPDTSDNGCSFYASSDTNCIKFTSVDTPIDVYSANVTSPSFVEDVIPCHPSALINGSCGKSFIGEHKEIRSVSISTCDSDPLEFRNHVRAQSLCSGTSSFYDDNSDEGTVICDGDDETRACNGSTLTNDAIQKLNDGNNHFNHTGKWYEKNGTNMSREGSHTTSCGFSQNTLKQHRMKLHAIEEADYQEFVADITNIRNDQQIKDTANVIKCDDNIQKRSEDISTKGHQEELSIYDNHQTSTKTWCMSSRPFAIIEAIIPRSSTIVAKHTDAGCVLDCGTTVCLHDGTVLGVIATLLGPVTKCQYAVVCPSPEEFAQFLMTTNVTPTNKVISGEVVVSETDNTTNSVSTPTMLSLPISTNNKTEEKYGTSEKTHESSDECEILPDRFPDSILRRGTPLYFHTTSANIIYDPATTVSRCGATDASFVDDIPLPGNARPDFSDDEEERAWKKTEKEKKKMSRTRTCGEKESVESEIKLETYDVSTTGKNDPPVTSINNIYSSNAEMIHESKCHKKLSMIDNCAHFDEDDISSCTESDAEFDDEGNMIRYIPRTQGIRERILQPCNNTVTPQNEEGKKRVIPSSEGRTRAPKRHRSHRELRNAKRGNGGILVTLPHRGTRETEGEQQSYSTISNIGNRSCHHSHEGPSIGGNIVENSRSQVIEREWGLAKATADAISSSITSQTHDPLGPGNIPYRPMSYNQTTHSSIYKDTRHHSDNNNNNNNNRANKAQLRHHDNSPIYHSNPISTHAQSRPYYYNDHQIQQPIIDNNNKIRDVNNNISDNYSRVVQPNSTTTKSINSQHNNRRNRI